MVKQGGADVKNSIDAIYSLPKGAEARSIAIALDGTEQPISCWFVFSWPIVIVSIE